MRVAEPLGRNDVAVDTLRLEIRGDVIGPTRRQIDIVGDADTLQARSDGLVVGIPIDDDLGVSQGLQTGEDSTRAPKRTAIRVPG